MEKEFIPYTEALALKELGFDEPCLKLWEKTMLFTKLVNPEEFKRVVCERYIKAPTFSQAFRWFREKYILDSIIQPTYSTKYVYRVFNVETKSKTQVYGDYMREEFNTYEEAELACLIKLIEIVKTK